jgi:hypothetical protein
VGEIGRCAADPEFVAAMGALWAGLDAEIAGRRAVCANRGMCCRFEEFGHRLFVTPAELAYFMATSEAPIRRPMNGDVCPYQSEGLCQARRGRPAGCRIFFCEAQARQWQGPLTERTLARLKELHGRFNLAYAYVEWLRALEWLSTG